MSTTKGSIVGIKSSPKFRSSSGQENLNPDSSETPQQATRAKNSTDETARISQIAKGSAKTPESDDEPKEEIADEAEDVNEKASSEGLSDEEETQLDAIFQYLLKLTNARKISVNECEALTNWAIDKVSEEKSIAWITGKLMSSKMRVKIIEKCRVVGGEERVENITREKVYTKQQLHCTKQNNNNDADNNNNNSPANKAHTFNTPGDEIWGQFRDEYYEDHEFSANELEVWKATLKVKLNQSELILKDLNSQMSTNRDKNMKFKSSDTFERYVKDLKADLVKVTLCSNRLEKGHLINPRSFPSPDSRLFRTVVNNETSFQSFAYSDSLMLFTNLNSIATKVSNYLFSVILTSMQDNAAAQEVIRAHGNTGDFVILFEKLKQRFQVNSEIEKEKLVTEFQHMVIGPKESIRAFYSRIMTTVSELWTVFEREILPEDIRRTFYQALSDASKNNFLQLESIDQYKANLDALCMEVIARQEQLESSVTTANLSVNNISSKRTDTRKCHNCGKIGHLKADCWSKPCNNSKPVDVNPKSRDTNRRDSSKSKHFMKKRKDNQKGDVQKKRFGHRKEYPSKRPHNANNVTDDKRDEEEDDEEVVIQCYLCNQRGDHTSAECKNAHADVQYHNQKHLKFQKANEKQDKANPAVKYRVCTVTIKPPPSKPSATPTARADTGPGESDYFTVNNRHGPEFAMLTIEVRIIVIDSGASKCMFGNRAMFT
jgi:hypothetical protein